MSDLPKDYDVIIVGTGLTESILAAALARVGKNILHIDRNQFYGGEFSSHSLSNLIEFAQFIQKPNQPIYHCNNDLSKYFFDIEYHWSNNENIQEKLTNLSRKFILDLCPNIFYSRGTLIELLISSDVAKYCEFKMVSQILTQKPDGTLEKVPTSRSEVFKSNQLSMIEKRVMMQFVQNCLKDNNFADLIEPEKAKNISFKEFIHSKKLPESISNYLINAVAMCPHKSAYEGLCETKKFLNSVGRFGDSPFLFSLYGSGELTQCFCRMAAVFGGIYYLNLTIEKFNLNQTNQIESIEARSGEENFKFNCKHLILDSSYAPFEYFQENFTHKQISRCILITDKSIFLKPNNETDHISCLFLPAKNQTSSDIFLLEVSYASHCCPQGYYVVYMFCEKTKLSSKEQFDDCIFELFSKTEENDPKPKILFSFYYSHLDSDYLVENSIRNEINKPDNLYLVSGAKCQFDFDHHVLKAQQIFKKICPGEEFMPKPPDPEDIIFDDTTQIKQETEESNQS